jgi:apolipoprotein N-acyltransferase
MVFLIKSNLCVLICIKPLNEEELIINSKSTIKRFSMQNYLLNKSSNLSRIVHFDSEANMFFLAYVCGIATYLSFIFSPLGFALSLLQIKLRQQSCDNISFKNNNSYSRFVLAYISFFCGYFSIALYWIAIPLYISGSFALIPFTVLPILFLSMVYGIAIGYTSFFSSTIIKSLHSNQEFQQLVDVFLIAITWTLCEQIQGVLFVGGFPWGLAGYSLSFSHAAIQGASVFGIYGLSTIAIIMWQLPKILFFSHKLFLTVLIVLGLYLAWACNRIDKIEKGPSYCIKNVLLVQTNVNMDDYYLTSFGVIDDVLQILRSHNSSTDDSIILKLNQDKNLKYDKPLIILPESIIREYFSNNLLEYIHSLISEEFRQYTLILGSIRNDCSFFHQQQFTDLQINSIIKSDTEPEEHNISFNSLYVIENGKIISYYDKILLAPFGEYMPQSLLTVVSSIVCKLFASITDFKSISNEVKDINVHINDLDLSLNNCDSDFSRGQYREVITISQYVSYKQNCAENYESNIYMRDIKILPIICYEGIFPLLNFVVSSSESIKCSKHFDMIINIVNDGWFGSSIMLLQHFQQTRMRAVEQSAALVRCANSGISCVINCTGRILQRANHKQATMLLCDVPIYSNIYSHECDNLRNCAIRDVKSPDTCGQNCYKTFFTRYGNITCSLLHMFMLLLIAILLRRLI